MQTAPALTAAGIRSRETSVVAEKKARSTPWNDLVVASSTSHSQLADGDLLAGRAVRGEQAQPLDGEAALQRDLEELLADEAGGSDDGDVVVL